MLPEKALEEMTLGEVRKRWPRITAHVIAESLGYAVPNVAAMIVQDGALGRRNYCEWVDACYGGNARRVLEDSISRRHYHAGYMAEYRRALEIVHRQNETDHGPELASWF